MLHPKTTCSFLCLSLSVVNKNATHMYTRVPGLSLVHECVLGAPLISQATPETKEPAFSLPAGSIFALQV